MCRLFGLHALRVPATATFWLLDAPDNLSEQSRRNPDATAIDLWALRYPEAHELHLLDRRDTTDTGPLHLRTDRIRAHSRHLSDSPSVVLASEPMDGDPRWYALEPGMLVHVDADLDVTRHVALPDPPRHQLSLEYLTGAAATSQLEPAASGR